MAIWWKKVAFFGIVCYNMNIFGDFPHPSRKARGNFLFA